MTCCSPAPRRSAGRGVLAPPLRAGRPAPRRGRRRRLGRILRELARCRAPPAASWCWPLRPSRPSPRPAPGRSTASTPRRSGARRRSWPRAGRHRAAAALAWPSTPCAPAWSRSVPLPARSSVRSGPSAPVRAGRRRRPGRRAVPPRRGRGRGRRSTPRPVDGAAGHPRARPAVRRVGDDRSGRAHRRRAGDDPPARCAVLRTAALAGAPAELRAAVLGGLLGHGARGPRRATREIAALGG